MEHDLRSVLGFDDNICLREPALEVAALVLGDVRDERLLPDSLVGVEQRLEHVPLNRDPLDSRLRLAEGIRRNRSDCVADIGRLVGELVEVGWADRRTHARRVARKLEVDGNDTRARVRATEYRRVQHPGQLHVGRIERLAAYPHRPVYTRHLLAHRRERSRRPLVERILVDHDPDFLVAPFDFLLGADQSCQVLMASSIFGYVPQRQRFPDIA